ncbi:MAG: hypothetical protein ACTSRI_02630 [Promethearchaeota archaeon]
MKCKKCGKEVIDEDYNPFCFECFLQNVENIENGLEGFRKTIRKEVD